MESNEVRKNNIIRIYIYMKIENDNFGHKYSEEEGQ